MTMAPSSPIPITAKVMGRLFLGSVGFTVTAAVALIFEVSMGLGRIETRFLFATVLCLGFGAWSAHWTHQRLQDKQARDDMAAREERAGSNPDAPPHWRIQDSTPPRTRRSDVVVEPPMAPKSPKQPRPRPVPLPEDPEEPAF